MRVDIFTYINVKMGNEVGIAYTNQGSRLRGSTEISQYEVLGKSLSFTDKVTHAFCEHNGQTGTKEAGLLQTCCYYNSHTREELKKKKLKTKNKVKTSKFSNLHFDT